MSDDLLTRYTSRFSEPVDVAAEANPDVTDSFGAFGWLRGTRERALMLELRKRDGAVTAIGYAWIERVEWDPSAGITLHALGRTFRITGRNLNAEARPHIRLFAGITRHKVPWVQEADRATILAADERAVVVESIASSEKM